MVVIDKRCLELNELADMVKMIWPFRPKKTGLTRQQYCVLRLMARGYSNKKIAFILGGRSEQTVKNHVSAILRVMDVPNRTTAVTKAIKQKMLSL